MGFWQAAFRDPDDPERSRVAEAIKARQPVTVDVLYGDYEGGQRMISRFLMQPGTDSADGSCRFRTTGTWTGLTPVDTVRSR